MTTIAELDLLEILCCPKCHETLHLQTSSVDEARETARHSPNADADSLRILQCECGAKYPIVDGVPRLVEDCQVSPSAEPEAQDGTGTSANRKDDFDSIRRSFSREWQAFDYETDKTWGWTLEERKAVFLGDVGFDPRDLNGKRLLDAGCGNGTLTAVLSSFGMEVVGLDLNEGLGLANARKRELVPASADRVNFVQGNLFNPPLRERSFDLIYCSGVIHHTPSSKETFKKLVPLVKTGGRLYIWVYGYRALPVRMFAGAGRSLKRIMSLESVMRVCRVVSPFFKVSTEFLDATGLVKFRKRTCREITLDLFDMWAPRFNHWHKESEVQSWFREMGFTNITISGRQKHGFGCYGDRL